MRRMKRKKKNLHQSRHKKRRKRQRTNDLRCLPVSCLPCVRARGKSSFLPVSHPPHVQVPGNTLRHLHPSNNSRCSHSNNSNNNNHRANWTKGLLSK